MVDGMSADAAWLLDAGWTLTPVVLRVLPCLSPKQQQAVLANNRPGTTAATPSSASSTTGHREVRGLSTEWPGVVLGGCGGDW